MRQQFTHTPLLGTLVEIQIGASPEVAADADEVAVAEFLRLNEVFSTYLDDSELNRWRRGEVDSCSAELVEVLTAAQHWYELSDGAFHPALGGLSDLWTAATDAAPAGEALSALSGAPLPYQVRQGEVVRLSDCSGVDLNAIAKGYIVDRALEAASQVAGVTSVMVNAGGDLRHCGEGSVRVRIEDPARPYDNAPPRWRVTIRDGALATSSITRRGFKIGGEHLGHVLDPRTGSPITHTASVTVLASSTMLADALATVLGVLPIRDALAFAAEHQLTCLLVEASGAFHTSSSWPLSG